MKKLWFGVLGLVLAGNVFGANWILVSENDGKKMFVDADSIIIKQTSSRYLIGAWEKIELNRPSVVPGFGTKPVKEMIAFNWNDCKNNSVSDITQWASYDTTGKTISSNSEDNDNLKFKMIIPGTISESLENFACTAALLKELKDTPDVEDKKNVIRKYNPKQFDYIMSIRNK